MKLTPFERKLLNRVQKDLPIVEQPFKAIADELGTSEDKVLDTIKHLKRKRIIRRFGGIFSSRKLGCYTTLVAGIVPEDKIDDAVKIINGYDEVTHNYMRNHRYNIWFTIIAGSKNRARQIIREIKRRTGIRAFREIPSERFYKLDLQLSL